MVAQVRSSVFCYQYLQSTPIYQFYYRSKTCPQCRSKVDERSIIKLYFQLSTYPTQDSATLENTVQNLKFQLKMKDIDVNRLTEENEKGKTQLAGLKYVYLSIPVMDKYY